MRYVVDDEGNIVDPTGHDHESAAVHYDERTGVFTFQLGSGIGTPVGIAGLVPDTMPPMSLAWQAAARLVWRWADEAWQEMCG